MTNKLSTLPSPLLYVMSPVDVGSIAVGAGGLVHASEGLGFLGVGPLVPPAAVGQARGGQKCRSSRLIGLGYESRDTNGQNIALFA